MSEFQPVTTLSDLAVQDCDEILAGYVAGLHGEPEPGSDKSRAFWHGWRNGSADAGRRPFDAAQRRLAAAYIANQSLH